ncbi:MAG: hypothetical protein HKN84_12835 [Gammaproteobacteria bacterium]|nr:hypothetical protein [Gammaproteobacteria bacterium]
MSIDRDTMLRMLRAELPEEEAAAYRRAIDADPNLLAEYRSVQSMHGLLRESRAESFGPYFSERVMKKLAGSASSVRPSLYESMQWVFLRLATACVLVVIGLGAYNVLDSRESDLASTTIDAAFGLPSGDLDSLFYLQGI